MKAKALVVTLTLVSMSLANAGGLGIDNVGNAMNIDRWVETNTSVETAQFAQGSVEAFENYQDNGRAIVDVEKLKHSYDGQG